MPLPPFSFEHTVSGAGAKQDKLDIRIEGGVLHGDADDAEEFLNRLGTPPEHLRSSSEIFPYGELFSRQQGLKPRFYDQKIRERTFISGGNKFAPPLVGGRLEIFRLQPEAWSLKVLASVNPTRFLRHQRIPWGINPFRQPPPPLQINLVKKTIAPSYDGEFAVCGNDNWLPDSPTWDYFSSETSWPTQLRTCLATLPQALIDDMQRAVGSMDMTNIGGSWQFNLRYVETYWEFASLCPLQTVLSLEAMLRMFSRRPLIAKDYRCLVEVEELENSRCLKLETRRGETLKIYAKTNRRIRFEIAHQLSGDRSFQIRGRRHTFQTITSVYPLLQHLASAAAQTVNKVLNHFRLNASTPANQSTVLEFICKVQAACGNPDLARELIQMLVANDSIVVGGNSPIRSIFGHALQSLTRDEVLHPSNERYSVTPAYRRALTHMQQKEMGFLLGTRKRRRR